MTTGAFGELAELRERPIPDQRERAALKAGYRQHRLDLSAPASRELLVEAGDCGLQGENYYAAARNPPHYAPIEGSVPHLWVRSGVADRLRKVDRRLARNGLRLWLFDAWRPNAVQSYFHDQWMPAALRARRPSMSDKEILAEVEAYWAAPTVHPGSPSPHLTGAAVDLTLCWADTRELLWMGSLFDDVSELAHLDRFEGDPGTTISISDDEARANRRLLYWAMSEGGFSANPSEWWHFSFGDQMWARLTGSDAAFYGAARPPRLSAARAAAE